MKLITILARKQELIHISPPQLWLQMYKAANDRDPDADGKHADLAANAAAATIDEQHRDPRERDSRHRRLAAPSWKSCL